jgi:hypothetical protein
MCRQHHAIDYCQPRIAGVGRWRGAGNGHCACEGSLRRQEARARTGTDSIDGDDRPHCSAVDWRHAATLYLLARSFLDASRHRRIGVALGIRTARGHRHAVYRHALANMGATGCGAEEPRLHHLNVYLYAGDDAALCLSGRVVLLKEFGLSEMQYSIFFMANAACAVVAPFGYLQLSRHLTSRMIITLCFAVIALAGVLIGTAGWLRSWVLAACIMPATIAMGVIRPPSTHLMLEQESRAVGSASSLINCSGSLIGSFGMLLMSAHWRTMILPLGLIHVIAGLLCGGLWLTFAYRPFIRQVPEAVPFDPV